MDLESFLCVMLPYLVYEAIRITYECWRDNLTFKQWWNEPLKPKNNYKMDA